MTPKLTILLAFGLACQASAQIVIKTNATVWVTNYVTVPVAGSTPGTNAPLVSGPAADAWSFITTAGVSNWMVAPFGIYSTTSKEWGGGLAVGYKLSEFVVPVLRLDYLAGDIWMPSANLQLQVPVTIMGKFTLIPFTFAGVATTIAGGGADNGTAVGMLGIGGAVRLSSHVDLVGDYELWNGGHFHADNQIRFGVLYKF
jgi:hypothetical protein